MLRSSQSAWVVDCRASNVCGQPWPPATRRFDNNNNSADCVTTPAMPTACITHTGWVVAMEPGLSCDLCPFSINFTLLLRGWPLMSFERWQMCSLSFKIFKYDAMEFGTQVPTFQTNTFFVRYFRRSEQLDVSESTNKLSKKSAWRRYQAGLHARFLHRLFFGSEDGDDMYVRNVDLLSQDYTELYNRK